MKVCVVGIGYVGLVAAACLADGGNHVICVDKDKKKIDSLKDGVVPIFEAQLEEVIKRNEESGRLLFTTDLKYGVENCKVIILAVGTPGKEDGSADISAVLSVAADIADYMPDYRIIVTKSTVPVGTYKKVSDVISSRTTKPFDYVSNPEFLKEGAAVDDFMKPDRVIMGTTNPEVKEVMEHLYAPFMRKSSRIMFMDPASAEMTKYAANAMLATRISFMNEIAALCETYKADVESVRRGIGSDSRIGNAFLFPGVGYGGSCFPKDVNALVYMGNQQKCPMSIVGAVQRVNYQQQERFASKIKGYFNGKKGVTLAVWGLAFKARTNDVRESPAVGCIDRLVEAGFTIRVFDPEAMDEANAHFSGKVEMGKNGYDILSGADALVILTDWQEFRAPDFDEIASRLRRQVIFDGRNLYDPAYVRKQGFEYHCVGRP
jgi:UDPglucose 6-dehydrogenase